MVMGWHPIKDRCIAASADAMKLRKTSDPRAAPSYDILPELREQFSFTTNSQFSTTASRASSKPSTASS
jgi:hypothetical protein